MLLHGPCFRPLLEQKLGGEVDPDAVCIARVVNDCPVAIFAFAGWEGDNIEGMLWSERHGLSRELLTQCARYVFGELGCNRITIRVQDDNADMIRVAPKLGFKHEGTMREAHQGHDVHIYGLLKKECRWYEEAKGPEAR